MIETIELQHRNTNLVVISSDDYFTALFTHKRDCFYRRLSVASYRVTGYRVWIVNATRLLTSAPLASITVLFHESETLGFVQPEGPHFRTSFDGKKEPPRKTLKKTPKKPVEFQGKLA